MTRVTASKSNILDLWVQGVSTRDIAAQLNCSAGTVQRVKRSDKYRRLFYERQNAQVAELLPLAIQRLQDILKDGGSATANAQIAAIRQVFDRAHLSELLGDGGKEIKITVKYE